MRGFTVPMLSNGTYRNVLTDNEKTYLEELLGLEVNALSVYNKKDNYWDNYLIRLTKQDTILDLSDPEDYIKYKVLLANKDVIAPSMKQLREARRATYEYVIMEPNEEFADSRNRVNNTMKCYEEFGAIKDNFDILRCVIETVDGRPVNISRVHDYLVGIVNPDFEYKVIEEKAGLSFSTLGISP